MSSNRLLSIEYLPGNLLAKHALKRHRWSLFCWRRMSSVFSQFVAVQAELSSHHCCCGQSVLRCHLLVICAEIHVEHLAAPKLREPYSELVEIMSLS